MLDLRDYTKNPQKPQPAEPRISARFCLISGILGNVAFSKFARIAVLEPNAPKPNHLRICRGTFLASNRRNPPNQLSDKPNRHKQNPAARKRSGRRTFDGSNTSCRPFAGRTRQRTPTAWMNKPPSIASARIHARSASRTRSRPDAADEVHLALRWDAGPSASNVDVDVVPRLRPTPPMEQLASPCGVFISPCDAKPSPAQDRPRTILGCRRE